MDTKIQELTDKIYKEGVEKGNEEAGRIIADANAQKQAILTEAEAEAKRIVAQAEKQAAPRGFAHQDELLRGKVGQQALVAGRRVEKEYGSRVEAVCYPICRSTEERSGKSHYGKNYLLQCESDRF